MTIGATGHAGAGPVALSEPDVCVGLTKNK